MPTTPENLELTDAERASIDRMPLATLHKKWQFIRESGNTSAYAQYLQEVTAVKRQLYPREWVALQKEYANAND